MPIPMQPVLLQYQWCCTNWADISYVCTSVNLCADENGKGTVKIDIKCGVPFEPANVYKMLQAIDFEAFKVRSFQLQYQCCASICYC